MDWPFSQWEDPRPPPPPPPPNPENLVASADAAEWLRGAAELFGPAARPWLRDIARAYAEWTAVANGSELAEGEHIDRWPFEWNPVYYDLAARCLPGMGPKEVDRLALDPIRSLPDKPFFNAAAEFLRSVDDVYFGGDSLSTREAVRIRAVLAERMTKSNGWRRATENTSVSVGRNIGPAIAALFFNRCYLLPDPLCSLEPLHIDRLDPFLPVLERLVAGGPGGFVAIATLNLVEVSPRPVHLPLLAAGAEAWLGRFPRDAAFWIDHGVGKRLCAAIGEIREHSAFPAVDRTTRDRLDRIVLRPGRVGRPRSGLARTVGDEGRRRVNAPLRSRAEHARPPPPGCPYPAAGASKPGRGAR